MHSGPDGAWSGKYEFCESCSGKFALKTNATNNISIECNDTVVVDFFSSSTHGNSSECAHTSPTDESWQKCQKKIPVDLQEKVLLKENVDQFTAIDDVLIRQIEMTTKGFNHILGSN